MRCDGADRISWIVSLTRPGRAPRLHTQMAPPSRPAVAILCVAGLIGSGFALNMASDSARAAAADATIDRFPIRADQFQLDRPTHAGAFFDVVGRRSALFGYENRTM